MGVEFGGLIEELEGESFPMGKAELLGAYGDWEIGMENHTTTLAELIEPLGEDEFEDPRAVHGSVITMTSDEAVGREGYSDRGGQARDEADDGESV